MNYTEKELNKVFTFITENFGEISECFGEMGTAENEKNDDLHFNIVIVPPTEEQPFYKLVTLGAGAYKMNVPSELKKKGVDRVEYVIYLPKDWDLDSTEDKWYWPVEFLDMTARFAFENNTWLGPGHSISGTGKDPFESLVLFPCYDKENENELPALKLDPNNQVRFLQLFPLYKEEAAFYEENGIDALIDILDEKSLDCVVDVKRRNCCK